MENTDYFSYREATNMTALEPLLRLRYQVFKEEESTKVRQSDFNPHQYAELERMAEAYSIQDCICYHPEEPENYLLPWLGEREVEERGVLVAA